MKEPLQNLEFKLLPLETDAITPLSPATKNDCLFDVLLLYVTVAVKTSIMEKPFPAIL